MSVDLILTRERPRNGATPGALVIPHYAEAPFGFRTLEDAPILIHDVPSRVEIAPEFTLGKVIGKTAIPAGRYRVGLSYSSRFKRLLPELFDVPQFTAIRLHGGNRPEDTQGCILVGTLQTIDGLGRPGIVKCAPAVNAIVRAIGIGLRTGDRKVWIEIRNGWLG